MYKCEWCGLKKEKLEKFPIDTIKGKYSPFKEDKQEFYACSINCKNKTYNYYFLYKKRLKLFTYLVVILMFCLFIVPIISPYSFINTLIIGLSLFSFGILINFFPFGHRFLRDKNSNLKISLKKFIIIIRILGSIYIITGFVILIFTLT